MALSRVKSLLLLCLVVGVATFVIVLRSDLFNDRKTQLRGLLLKRDAWAGKKGPPRTRRLNVDDRLIAHKWKGKGRVNKMNQGMAVFQNSPIQKATPVITTPSRKLPRIAEKAHEKSMLVGFLNTSKLKVHKWFYSPEEKESKWERCKRLISGEEKLNESLVPSNDSNILEMYSPDQDCSSVLQARFGHPPVTEEESHLPIGFSFLIYKNARLFERILQAIYMPHNVYCIHIDKKSPAVLHDTIQATIRCLPNVFISANSTKVFWGHFSVVQAQLYCMQELLQSPVKWKYYINLVGQDFPLYVNSEIVRALQGLNNHNNIQSLRLSKSYENRTKFVHVKNEYGTTYIINEPKGPPPQNITIFKGSTFIIATREFVDFVIYSQVAKDFVKFLKDTFVPDETLYASLEQYPGAPGGIRGRQPRWISRALYWRVFRGDDICHGIWIRLICWITFEDLQWALGDEKKDKLFIHKIPFDFSDDLIECILVARQGRKYPSGAWNQETRRKANPKEIDQR